MNELHVMMTKTPGAPQRPGMEHVGWAEAAPGSWVPLYEPAPTAGKPSINTAAGWNALAERLGQ